MQEVLSMDFFGEDGEVAYEARWIRDEMAFLLLVTTCT